VRTKHDQIPHSTIGTRNEEFNLTENEPGGVVAGPSDAELSAELDISSERAGTWRQLLALAEDFAAYPRHDQDSVTIPSTQQSDGTWAMGYVTYGARIQESVDLLYAVGAVSPSFPWMKCPIPQTPDNGTLLSVADAMRLATALVRADRFVEGRLGLAAEDGELQAVVTALAAWYISDGSGRATSEAP
jgi:Family of unknown function (DUF6508)